MWRRNIHVTWSVDIITNNKQGYFENQIRHEKRQLLWCVFFHSLSLHEWYQLEWMLWGMVMKCLRFVRMVEGWVCKCLLDSCSSSWERWRKSEKQTEMSFNRHRFVAEVNIQTDRLCISLDDTQTCIDIQERENPSIIDSVHSIEVSKNVDRQRNNSFHCISSREEMWRLLVLIKT